jgi:hypothetical protein
MHLKRTAFTARTLHISKNDLDPMFYRGDAQISAKKQPFPRDSSNRHNPFREHRLAGDPWRKKTALTPN